MTALSKSRTVRSIPGILFSYPVLADAVIHQGAIVVINSSSGFALPATTATGRVAVGIARESVTGTAVNGGVRVEVEEGIFDFANSANADLIAFDDIGKVCYLVDDQTVALTDGGATRSPAGIIKGMDGSRVFVKVEAKVLA